MATVVLEVEPDRGAAEAILRYPEAFCGELVDEPHGGTVSLQKTAVKRVKTRKLNKGELLQREYHSQIRDRLMESYTRLLEAGRRCGYFPLQQPAPVCAQSSEVDLAALCKLDALVPTSDDLTYIIDDENEGSSLDPFGHLVHNSTGKNIVVDLWGKRFRVPFGSSFLLSDFSKIGLLADCSAALDRRYDLIVVDPPWENRSAIRGRKYEWLPMESLLHIPVPALVSPGALVAVWVTNKRRFAHFVALELFTAWGLEAVGEWHWIKVTTAGALVFDMESSHKKPYETLILGRYRGGVGRGPPMANKDCTAETEGSIGGRHPSTERTIRSASEEHRSVDPPDPLHSRHCNDTLTTSTSTHAEERSEHTPSVSQAEDQVKPSLKRPRLSASEHKCLMFADDQGHTPNVPQHGVLLCVPSKTHSRKPYLGDILSKYVPDQKLCLELFARNLLPNWTSWGNEVLKFQELPYQNPAEADDPS